MNVFRPFIEVKNFVVDFLDSITPFFKLFFIWGFSTPLVAMLTSTGSLDNNVGFLWIMTCIGLFAANRFGLLNSRIILSVICFFNKRAKLIQIYHPGQRPRYSISFTNGVTVYTHLDYFSRWQFMWLNDDGTVRGNILNNVSQHYRWLPASKSDRALFILTYGDINERR